MIKGIMQDGVLGKVTSVDGPIVAVSNIAYTSCDLCKRNLEPTLNLTVEGKPVFVCKDCLEGLVASELRARRYCKEYRVSEVVL